MLIPNHAGKVFSRYDGQSRPKKLIQDVIQMKPLGLFADFDGTLSGIAPTPQQVRISNEIKDVISSLREKVAFFSVISGREVENLEILVGVKGIIYVGNHGAEIHLDDQRLYTHPQANQLRSQLSEVLDEIRDQFPELYYEHKGLSVSVHYRGHPDPERIWSVLFPLAVRIARSKGMGLIPGKSVVDIRPNSISKGEAVSYLAKNWHLSSAIYLGDDLTDVDAFKTIASMTKTGQLKGVSVGVLSDETPNQVVDSADIIVEETLGVTDLLMYLNQELSLK